MQSSIRSSVNEAKRDTLGAVHFEIANHLGNVVAVVSDRKIAVDTLAPFEIDHFLADRIMLRDYYAFGMTMPGRSWAVDSSYRFGFNGKEKMLGLNGLDFGARIYDQRLIVWLSPDPLAAKYPGLSPYAYVANNPIMFIDPNGKEIKITKLNDKDKSGNSVYVIEFTALLVNNSEIVEYTKDELTEIASRMESAIKQYYSGQKETSSGEIISVVVNVRIETSEQIADDSFHEIEIVDNLIEMTEGNAGRAEFGKKWIKITMILSIECLQMKQDVILKEERPWSVL